jgi:hypothetical protein
LVEDAFREADDGVERRAQLVRPAEESLVPSPIFAPGCSLRGTACLLSADPVKQSILGTVASKSAMGRLAGCVAGLNPETHASRS